MKVSELIKVLKKSGCNCVEHGAEHDKWYSKKSRKYFRVPRHKAREIPSGTLNHILKDAGLRE
jgi:predicted RNA binding protein YcfA (HicA-like mRNA interferase family)